MRKSSFIIKLNDFAFLLYLCGLTAFNRGVGFDALYCRGSFVIWIISEVMDIVYSEANQNLRINNISLRQLLFFGYYILSGILLNFDDAIYYAGNIIQIVSVVLLLPRHIKSKRDVERYLFILLIAYSVMAVRLFLLTPFSVWGTERLGDAMALNANSVGMYCSTAMLICLYFSNRSWINVVPAALFAMIAFFSGSRKAFLMVIGGFCGFYVGRKRGIRTLAYVVIAGFAVFGIYRLVMTNQALYQVLGYRLERGLTSLSDSEKVIDGSLSERRYFRQYAMQMFFKRPLFGYGANGFVTEMENIGYWYPAYSHCNYTEILSTLGIIGFVLYYWNWGTIVFSTLNIYFKRNNRLVLFILLCSLLFVAMEFYNVAYISVDQQMLVTLFGAALQRQTREDIIRNKPMQKGSLLFVR